MEKPFTIRFDYPLKDTGITVKLEATAELHHSIPYYLVSHFRMITHTENNWDALPEIRIKPVIKDGRKTWVHTDSEFESDLSRLAGKEIDEAEASGK